MKKTKGIIAAGHPQTAAAGAAILREGGNAFDAALAAMLASCVAEPSTTSAGGGGFMLGYNAHVQRGVLFDFFTQTPHSKKINTPLDFKAVGLNFGAAIQEFHIGMASAGVPSFIKGVFHIHKRLGKLPLSVIIQPAADLAKNGLTVSPYQSSAFKMLAPICLQSKAGEDLYLKNGALIKANDVFYMPHFADTLEHLVAEGERAFYEGEIAQSIVKDCQERGGYLRLADFKNYEVIERKPLKCAYHNKTFFSNPPPCSGGILIAFALKLLEKRSPTLPPFASAAENELLTNVMRLTNKARKEGLDKNIYKENLAEYFLSSEFMAAYHAEMPLKRGCTTHISAMDGEGNAASVTTSHGEGCGYFIPNTSIMLNNMLGEEDLNPTGFHQWRENVRLSSMMSPSMVLNEQGQVEIVTGSGGANRIRTAILQTVHRLVNYNLPIHQAVNDSRIHWENEVLYTEPFADKGVYNLAKSDKLVTWDTPSMFFGGVHTVGQTADGDLVGAGDKRRDGACILVE